MFAMHGCAASPPADRMAVVIPLALTLVALILALIEEFRTHGTDLIGWAVVCLSLAALWGRL